MVFMRKNTKSWSHGRIRQGKSPHTIGEITWVIRSRRQFALSLEPAESCRYQRAYVDFFEDQLVLNGYNWKQVLSEYLFIGKEPLINCMIAGRMWFCLVRRGVSVRNSSQLHSWSPTYPLRLRLRALLARIGHGSTRPGDYLIQLPAQIP